MNEWVELATEIVRTCGAAVALAAVIAAARGRRRRWRAR